MLESGCQEYCYGVVLREFKGHDLLWLSGAYKNLGSENSSMIMWEDFT